MELVFIFGAIMLGVVTGYIADKKGHSGLLWGIFGILMAIIALPMACMLPDNNKRKCPNCAAKVPKEARVCMHCGTQLA